MEGDDRAVAGVSLDIVQNIVCMEPFGIIACDKVPHDDAIFLAKPIVDTPTHPSVGWPKEWLGSGGTVVHGDLCPVDIEKVGRCPVLE